ncbi:hypothetical protein roselon_02967 [Roseibacterium elongatum DSM 19469]|uniref:Outer membrane protein beta-barrel domain-containing protein n=1 Tax=Roseicyclus elongatus DSM 19469 TaxID=1294273 RepID=W8S4V2_9RHOB|nr:outer membrane beta-barrel protein [Roseibacterium elongatum]AHM05252.1 hypothetical protein roselon_02967 [Roseibacterium elongatum DSM 19469]
MMRAILGGTAVAAVLAIAPANTAQADPLGLYFGASGVIGIGELSSTSHYVVPEGIAAPLFEGNPTETFDIEGGGVNLRVGYMTELGGFLVGGELSGMMGSMVVDDTRRIRVGQAGTGYDDRFELSTPNAFEITDLVELRALVGMTLGGGFSVFGTAGYAFGQGESMDGRIDRFAEPAAPGHGRTQDFDVDGYSFGVGTMYQLNDNAALTLQYTYTDFGSYDVPQQDFGINANGFEEELDITLGRVEMGFVIGF